MYKINKIENTHLEFEDIVNNYKDNVFNVCLGYLQNREEAEDVSQEVFIEVFNSINSFRGESSIKTWLYRISVNKSLDAIRSKKAKKRFAPLLNIFHLEGNIEPINNTNPQNILEQEEQKMILLKCIDKLSVNQKNCIILNKIEGLSQIETANILNLSVSAVETNIYRGKIELKKILTKYYYNDFARKR